MNPRRFARPRHFAVRLSRLCMVALLFSLPACFSWRPVDLAPPSRLDRHGSVRVERSDGSYIVVARPRIAGDSIVGRTGRAFRTPTALPLTGVTRVWESRFNAKNTAVLVGVMGLAAALIYQGLTDMNVGLAPSGTCFGGC